MQAPLVTFLSTCYNHSKFIIESLESIRNQSYPNIQHIIIDDCSKDDSVSKIKKWIDDNDYKCEFIQHKVNKGISYSLNESIELAKGEFWTPLATDDFIVPERTELFVEFLMSHTNTYMVTSDCKLVDEGSNEIFVDGTSSFMEYLTKRRADLSDRDSIGTYNSLLVGNYIPSSIMLRTQAFREIGMFNTKLKVEDWDMWLRVSDKSKIEYIDKTLTKYRFHQNNSINQSQVMLRDFLYTFLKQEIFCKRNGSLNDYNRLYEQHFYHLEIDGINRMLFFFENGPKLKFLKTIFKKLKNKIPITKVRK